MRPGRTERIVIYASRESKNRWLKTVPDLDARNYEEALMLLLDLYEAAAEAFGERRIRALAKKIREMGEYRLRVVR